MEKFNPKVSIVIPVYNGSNYLKEAIDSALAQTYNNIEIIVVNDGSNDDGKTEAIAKSYGRKIRYFNKPNGGVASALNFGIKKMKGEYFSWLSHDDLFCDTKIEEQINVLEESGKVLDFDVVVATSFSYFNEKGIIAKVTPKKSYRYAHPLSYLFSGYINGCTLLIPKKILISVDGFNENLPTTQDFDLWFRIFRKYKLVFLEKDLFLSRSHIDQGSKIMLNEHVAECEKIWIEKINELTDQEKEAIHGSVFNFYNMLYKFLKANTLYYKVILYVRNKMLSLFENNILNGISNKDNEIKEFIKPEALICNKNKKKHMKTIYFPIFGDYNDRGGLNKMVSMVANELSNYYNVVISSFSSNDSGYELNDSISYYQITNLDNYEGFVDLAIMLNVDLTIFSHNCDFNVLNVVENMKKFDFKVVCWNHEDFFLPYYNSNFSHIWPIRNKIFAKVDAVLWLTNASCKAYNLINDNGLVIPNFMSTKNKIKKISDKKINNRIIAIARFDDPRKRINLLIETYEKIHAVKPYIELVILGTIDFKMKYNDNENIKQAIERINKEKKYIECKGFVKDVENYYKTCDLNILPSYNEGFGLTILESSLFNVPTAVFDNSGFDDIIDNGLNGIIVEEANTSKLAEAIVSLYDDELRLLKMKDKSFDIIKKFDKNQIILKWKSLIDDLLTGNLIVFNDYSYDKNDMEKISKGYNDALNRVSKKLKLLAYYQMIELNGEKSLFRRAKRVLRNNGLLGTFKKIINRLVYGRVGEQDELRK